jgi:proteasome lid subunit RPN8/RPN11
VAAASFVVGDWVLEELAREVAGHPPERGGALLGPRLRPLVTRFVPDPDAAADRVSWAPSRRLDAAVKALERDEGLELKGVVHSHPAGHDRPSSQDVRELARGLALNGHMPCYLAPIVTAGGPAPLAPHELPLPSGKLSCFAAWRKPRGGAEVRPLRPRLLPLQRDLSRLARDLGAATPALVDVDAGAGLAPGGRLSLPGGAELLVIPGDGHPAMPPLLLLTRGGETEPLHVPWRLDVPEEERLVRAVREAIRPPGPFRRLFGPRGGPALTADPSRAALAGWEPRLSGEDAEAAAAGLGEALLARGAGLLAPSLRDRTVLVAGLGSVGSYVAEQLARSGVGGFALLDPEPVEAANLSRTVYGVADVGRPKTEALARRLLSVAPSLRLDLRPVRVDALSPAELDALVVGADLVVATTDDPAAQRALDRFAYARGRPGVFVGLYAGAEGGEVILTVPERTPCYLCATRARHAMERTAGRVERDRLRGGAARGGAGARRGHPARRERGREARPLAAAAAREGRGGRRGGRGGGDAVPHALDRPALLVLPAALPRRAGPGRVPGRVALAGPRPRLPGLRRPRGSDRSPHGPAARADARGAGGGDRARGGRGVTALG